MYVNPRVCAGRANVLIKYLPNGTRGPRIRVRAKVATAVAAQRRREDQSRSGANDDRHLAARNGARELERKVGDVKVS